MDVRRAEFDAMIDAFLGEDSDPEKREELNQLQIKLHAEQTELANRLTSGEVSPEEYYDELNRLIANNLAEVERTLGKEDFVKVFKRPRSEMGDFGDREAFIEANRESKVQGDPKKQDRSDEEIERLVENAKSLSDAICSLSETENEEFRRRVQERLRSPEGEIALILQESIGKKTSHPSVTSHKVFKPFRKAPPKTRT
jgi:hypothetical protein